MNNRSQSSKKSQRSKKSVKLALGTLLLSGIISIAFADDDPYTQATYSVGVNGIYSNMANALPELRRDQNHFGFGATFGMKSSLFDSPNIYQGFEVSLNHLGRDAWSGGQSANYNQLDALYVLHWFPVQLKGRVDLQAKVGAAWQYDQQNNMGSNVNWFAAPVIGASVDVYVASRVSVGASWLYTFAKGDGDALSDNRSPVASNRYELSLTYHF